VIATTTVSAVTRHARWVRIAHAIVTVSVLTLAFTGVEILMVHPRLYWGEAGNDLMPALLELPISRNYQHGGWTAATPFFDGAAGPVTANRTYDIFNQNGWGRSLHFLAAWWLIVPGAIYLAIGFAGGHFRSHVWPRAGELGAGAMWDDLVHHLRAAPSRSGGGPQYGLLQKCAYSAVVFVAAPLMGITGLAMSPAVSAALPFLPRLFGGYQSARTVHFFTFVALLLFVLVHVAMVARTGFRRQVRAITAGD
jgi:thiosulfate reductase cytochrome b subunit